MMGLGFAHPGPLPEPELLEHTPQPQIWPAGHGWWVRRFTTSAARVGHRECAPGASGFIAAGPTMVTISNCREQLVAGASR